MSIKSIAAAAAVLQLQLHQHPCESIQNVKLSLCTKFGNNECITSQIIQYAVFSSYMFEKILQLQLLYCSCSSRTFLNLIKISNYLYVPELVKINESIIQIVAAAAVAVLQLQGCSCSSSILLNRFRMSNNPWVWSLVIINALFPKLFNLLLLPA